MGSLSVQIVIALSQKSSVSKLILHVDKLGYFHETAIPQIQVSGGNSISNLRNWGVWNLSEGENMILPYSQKEFALKTPITCHLVCLHLSLPSIPFLSKVNRTFLDGELALHLGKIQVLGKPLQQHSKLLNPLTYVDPSEKTIYENLYKKKPATQRISVKPLSTHYRSGGRILDMCIEQTIVSGFTVLIRHGEEGPNTQVKPQQTNKKNKRPFFKI